MFAGGQRPQQVGPPPKEDRQTVVGRAEDHQGRKLWEWGGVSKNRFEAQTVFFVVDQMVSHNFVFSIGTLVKQRLFRLT